MVKEANGRTDNQITIVCWNLFRPFPLDDYCQAIVSPYKFNPILQTKRQP
jgi:hypothetical protein